MIRATFFPWIHWVQDFQTMETFCVFTLRANVSKSMCLLILPANVCVEWHIRTGLLLFPLVKILNQGCVAKWPVRGWLVCVIILKSGVQSLFQTYRTHILLRERGKWQCLACVCVEREQTQLLFYGSRLHTYQRVNSPSYLFSQRLSIHQPKLPRLLTFCLFFQRYFIHIYVLIFYTH